MDGHVKLQLTTSYTKHPPLITLNINGETIFDGELKEKNDFEHVVQNDHSLQ